MKITYLGHACFRIEDDGCSLILDPYEAGSVPGLSDLNETADLVLCSHGHGDHAGRSAVTLTGRTGLPFTVSRIESWHDAERGAKRGPNAIHIIETKSGRKIVHMGDIGCYLDDSDAAKLEGADVLLVPVGGFFTIDGKEAAELVRRVFPKVAVPMHYRSESFGYPVISTVDVFAEAIGGCVVSPDSFLDDDSIAANTGKAVILPPENRI